MRKGHTENSTTCSSERRCIFVIAPNWLGDAVMATPFLFVLRSFFPEAFVHVLCRAYIAEVYRRCSAVDVLFDFERAGGFRARFSAMRGNRPRWGWDWCFVLPVSFSSALLAFLSGAGRRIGYGGELRDVLLTDVLPRSGYQARHLSEVYVSLAERSAGTNAGGVPLPVVVPPYEWQQVLARKGLDHGYIVLAPGAAYGSAKIWPADRFAALAALVSKETGWPVIVVGTADERSNAAAVLGSSGVRGSNMAGECSTGELLSVLRGASLVIGNDSGPVHLSSAMGRPTVTLFGSTDPGWTAPRGEAVRIVTGEVDCSPCFERECPTGEPRCLLNIAVNDVYESAIQLIEEGYRDEA